MDGIRRLGVFARTCVRMCRWGENKFETDHRTRWLAGWLAASWLVGWLCGRWFPNSGESMPKPDRTASKKTEIFA